MDFSRKCKVKEEMTQSFRGRSKQGLPSTSHGVTYFSPSHLSPQPLASSSLGLWRGWALTWDMAEQMDKQLSPELIQKCRVVNLGAFVIFLPHSHILTSLQWPQNPASPEHPLHELIWPAVSDASWPAMETGETLITGRGINLHKFL